MRLLIVDDEMPIRKGLVNGIDWQSVGIEQVFSAENGLAALDICHKFQPELVITDIRMPGISGLELSKQILRMYSPVRIIILSGYSEFSYAQEAVKIGVSDYLLKPIDEEAMIEKVKACKRAILRDVSDTRIHAEIIRQHQQKHREHLLQEGRVLKNTDLEDLAEYAAMSTAARVMVACISIDDIAQEKRSSALDYLSTSLLALEAKQFISLYHNARSIFVLMPAEEPDQSLEILHEWHERTNAMMANQFLSGISIAVSEIGTLCLAAVFCTQAELALAHRLYKGGGCFVDWEEVKTVAGSAKHLELPREKLVSALDLLRMDMATELLEGCFTQFRQLTITTTEPLIMFCLELKSLVVSTFKERGLPEELLLDSEIAKGDLLKNYVTVDGFEQWAHMFCETTIERVRSLTGKISSKEVMRATAYIAQNFTQDISLTDVAGHVGKSKNYFSSMFKQEMGVTFVEYVNNLRLEEACRLLRTTERRSYEIAASVGFCNYKYFSTVFRKKIGCGPDKYRREAQTRK